MAKLARARWVALGGVQFGQVRYGQDRRSGEDKSCQFRLGRAG